MTTDTFNIYRNVYETFPLIIPNFVPSTSPQATGITISDATVTPSFIAWPSAEELTTSSATASGVTVTTGGTTHTYSALVSNCQILQTINSSFSSTSTSLGIGSSGSNSYKTWIPFTVSETYPIVSATISLVAAENDALTNVSIKLGCELSGNPVVPSGVTLLDYYNDLNSRIMSTTFTLDTAVPAWVIGTTYTYDVTNSINEILNLSSWISGHIIAILIRDNGSTLGVNRQIASYQNGTYTKPVLTITI